MSLAALPFNVESRAVLRTSTFHSSPVKSVLPDSDMWKLRLVSLPLTNVPFCV